MNSGFLKHFIVIGSGTLISMVISFFTTPIITRVVNPVDYGQFSIFTMYSSMALMILCFGMGRHVPYKGYTYLIQASKLLDDRFSICIAGKGPLTESLKEEAKDDPKVEFLGRVSDEDMIAYYMACDIFCFPSVTKNEAFGIALAEGMYFEKPAITFTIPGSGVNYVSIANETGIECPNGDVKAYAKALKKLAEDEKIRVKYGVYAKKRVKENFMFEQFGARISKQIANF